MTLCYAGGNGLGGKRPRVMLLKPPTGQTTWWKYCMLEVNDLGGKRPRVMMLEVDDLVLYFGGRCSFMMLEVNDLVLYLWR